MARRLKFIDVIDHIGWQLLQVHIHDILKSPTLPNSYNTREGEICDKEAGNQKKTYQQVQKKNFFKLFFRYVSLASMHSEDMWGN